MIDFGLFGLHFLLRLLPLNNALFDVCIVWKGVFIYRIEFIVFSGPLCRFEQGKNQRFYHINLSLFSFFLAIPKWETLKRGIRDISWQKNSIISLHLFGLQFLITAFLRKFLLTFQIDHSNWVVTLNLISFSGLEMAIWESKIKPNAVHFYFDCGLFCFVAHLPKKLFFQKV